MFLLALSAGCGGSESGDLTASETASLRSWIGEIRNYCGLGVGTPPIPAADDIANLAKDKPDAIYQGSQTVADKARSLTLQFSSCDAQVIDRLDEAAQAGA